jgi:hypothetical protein
MIEGQCSTGAIACPVGGNYDLLEVNAESKATGRILARGLPYSRVKGVPGVNIVNVSDPRCKTQSPAGVYAAQPSAQTVTEPSTDSFQNPLPATEAPVLPARHPTTRQALPSGSGTGSPFESGQPRKKIPVAKVPAPMEEPLGPVPLAQWVYGFMGIEQT